MQQKTDLANLKSYTDRLNIDKSETTPDLGRLSNVVRIKLLARLYMRNWLKKVNAIKTVNTNYLVKKAAYLKRKIPNYDIYIYIY